VTEWARRADAAGFHGLAVHDRPYHDAWEPPATLAAVAAGPAPVQRPHPPL
jgi:hypothetical protein